MGNQPVLELRDIRKAFPRVVALDEVSFDLLRGEVHVLLGENGAGKSTLMNILGGAYRKVAGEILRDGSTIATHPISEVVRGALAGRETCEPGVDPADLPLCISAHWAGRKKALLRP